MKVSPMSAPTQTAVNDPGKDVRSRAVAKYMNQTPESAPMPQTTGSAMQEAAASATPPSPQEGQVDKVEAPEVTETPKEEPLSSQFAQLARKEKALRAKAQAQEASLRQREEAIRQREEALQTKAAPEAPQAPTTVSVEDLMIDPLGTLERLGLNYDKLTERAANQVNSDPTIKAYIQKLEAKINQLEQDTKGTKQSIEDQQKSQYQQAIGQIKREAQALVQSDPQFESIKETDSVDDIVELIEKTFKEDGILMSVDEAAREVENELSERLISYATKINKVKSKFQTAAPVDKAPATPTKQESESTQQQQPPMRTLTNAQGTSRPLSARERAIKAFRGDKA